MPEEVRQWDLIPSGSVWVVNNRKLVETVARDSGYVCGNILGITRQVTWLDFAEPWTQDCPESGEVVSRLIFLPQQREEFACDHKIVSSLIRARRSQPLRGFPERRSLHFIAELGFQFESLPDLLDSQKPVFIAD
jgi:hypothetical protein